MSVVPHWWKDAGDEYRAAGQWFWEEEDKTTMSMMSKLKKTYLKLLKAQIKRKQIKAQKLYAKMIALELEMKDERESKQDVEQARSNKES